MIEVRRRQRWHILLLLGLSVGLYYGGVQQALHGLLSHQRWNWTDMAVYGGIWAVLWLPSWLLGQAAARRGLDRGWISKTPARRRRDHESQLVKPAIEVGALPPDADPEAWRAALRAETREATLLRWMLTVVLTGIAGVTAAAAIVANDNAWGVWTVAILVAAEGMATFLLLGRRLRVIGRLLSQLQ